MKSLELNNLITEKDALINIISDAEAKPGECPKCHAFDDDLSYRDGICETCYKEN